MAELVHRIINRIYCCEYIGRLEVTELCNFDGQRRGWLLILGLHSDERPLQIAFDGSDVDFLYRIHNTLHKDRLHHTEYFNGYKIVRDPNQAPTTNISSKYPKASII